MDLASVVAALASVGVRVSGSTPNNNIQGDSSRACPTGLAGPEPSGTHNDPGQHFHTAAATGTYTTTAVKYDPTGTNEARRVSKTFFLGGVTSLGGLKNIGSQVAT